MKRVLTRPPDFVIEHPEGVYLRRWWLIPRNRWFNVYLHNFLLSDDDRALHDHAWTFNISILVKGRYLEHRPGGKVRRRRRFIPIVRFGKAPHRVELIDNQRAWTIFITGRKVREWGFYCPQGWKHWKDFVSNFKGGNGTGPGCSESVQNDYNRCVDCGGAPEQSPTVACANHPFPLKGPFDAPCVQQGVDIEVGRDGRRHIFDCGMVLSGDGPCDSTPLRKEGGAE